MMAQTAVEGEQPRTKGGDRDSPATVHKTDFTDSTDSIISGDGDGFPTGLWESHAGAGRRPSKRNSGLFKGSMLSTTPALTDSHQIPISVDHPWKNGRSLHERKPLTDNTHKVLTSYPTLNPEDPNTRPELQPFGKLSPERYAEDDTLTTGEDQAGLQDRGKVVEGSATEVIGEAVKQPLDGDQAAAAKDGVLEKGIWVWDRSTVLALAVFVGLRLVYEAWFGHMEVFLNPVGEGGSDL